MMQEINGLLGSIFRDENDNEYTITKKMKAGFQGTNYEVEDKSQKKYVLKLISEFDKIKETQIRNVMKCRESHKTMFDDLERKYDIYCSWPLHIVSTDTFEGKFNGGYIMDLLPLENCVTYEHIEHDFEEWDYEELCRVSIQLCRGLGGFHNAGYCYKDVSKNNIMFDMEHKKLYIIDMDNVTLTDKEARSDVGGTPGFMAPEISRGEVYPNTQSDFFSIAVVLFYIWSKGHPFEGIDEDSSIDIREYMKNPVFIFHPEDKSNAVESAEEEFEDVIYWWKALPKSLQRSFTTAFVDKLESNKRISVRQWIIQFQDILDEQLMPCPHCGKMVAKDASYCGFCGEDKEVEVLTCPKCGEPVDRSRKSCVHCHTSFTVCNSCGNLNEKSETKCRSCGNVLKKVLKTVQVMEVYEDDILQKKCFAIDKERELSGEMLSERLKKYKKVLRFELYDDNGKPRMVLRNLLPYLNWRVVTKEGKVLPLAPGGRVVIDKIEQIALDHGVSLKFGTRQIEE